MKKQIKKRILVICVLFLFCLAPVGWANYIVITHSKPHIISESEALLSASDEGNPLEGKSYDAIIVLGAGVRNGKPSPLLAERLDTGIALFHAGYSNVLLMSGDSEIPEEYDEISVMTEYAVSRGVPRDAVLGDTDGLNTHKTVYNARYKYELDNYILVSQNYHLERGVYLGKSFGAEVQGVYCDKIRYFGQFKRDLREIPARTKDYFIGLLQLVP